MAKVGILDDPIWNEPAPVPVRSMPNPRAARRCWLVAALTGVVVLAVVAVWIIRSGHPGGDTNGVVLTQIRTAVEEAVPAESVPAGSKFADSQWQGCGYESGRFGWSSPPGGTAFRTGLTDQQVVSYASANLGHHGWRQASRHSTGGYGVWTKTLSGGSLARLRLVKGFAIPDGWTAWADAVASGATCPGTSP
jgi:hypothetical protein